MHTKLSLHFKEERLRMKLSLGDVARLVGYRNISKGASRIHKFEECGVIENDLLTKLSIALGVDGTATARLIEEDRREFLKNWNIWANEPIQSYLVVRLMPACYIAEELPEVVKTPNEAEAFAAGRARHWRRKVCLVLSRRHSVWLDEEGEVYDRTETVPEKLNTPDMRLRRNRPFLLQSIPTTGLFREVPFRPGPRTRGRRNESDD